MKNVTFSADAALIDTARRRAAEDQTTLNEAFRLWLADYAHSRERMQRYDDVMSQLRGTVRVGRSLTRDQRNER